MHKLPIDYQLSDVEIMDGQGVILPLRGTSAKGEMVAIGQLTVHEWFFVFTPALKQFNKWLDNSFEFAALMGQMSAEAIEENAGRVHKMLVSNQRAALFMADLLRKVKVSRWKPHKFLQMVTMEQLVEIFVLVYLFNTDGLKKKISLDSKPLRGKEYGIAEFTLELDRAGWILEAKNREPNRLTRCKYTYLQSLLMWRRDSETKELQRQAADRQRQTEERLRKARRGRYSKAS